MLEFLSANLPIFLCFLFGIGLLVAEVFMPGFGVAGISGIVLELACIVITYVYHGGLAALGVTIIILAVIGITISLSLRSATKGRLSKSPIILNDVEAPTDGYTATKDMEVFLGKQGATTTVLHPTGMAEFDGVRLNVVSEGEYIPKDTQVRISSVDGARIVVRRVTE